MIIEIISDCVKVEIYQNNEPLRFILVENNISKQLGLINKPNHIPIPSAITKEYNVFIGAVLCEP